MHLIRLLFILCFCLCQVQTLFAQSVKELEIGMEWQPVPQFELVCHYTMSRRRFEDYVLQDNSQRGSLLRIQAQVNF